MTIKTKEINLNKILIILLLSVLYISATDFYVNDNKLLLISPRYSALGGSGLAFVADATPVANPANLSLPGKNGLNLGYTGYFSNTFSTSLSSFNYHLSDKLGIGASLGYIFIPDIELNDNSPILNGEVVLQTYTKTSSELFFNFALGYTFSLSKKILLATGASLHCQRRRLIDWTGYGIGADAGLTFLFTKTGIRLSLLIDDITTNYIHWSTNYHNNGLPHAKLGFGWRKELPYIYGSISLMYKSPDLFSNEGVEFDFLNGGTEIDAAPKNYSLRENPWILFTASSFGLDYNIYKIVSIRAGIDDIKRIHFGAGLNLFSQRVPVDFAYMISGDLPGTYSMSVGLQW
jgi:hypothetical protein